MTVTRFADHLTTGNHAGRPAATALPVGSLYSCTTHSLVYQGDGVAWSTWATLGGGGATDHGALTGLADDDHPQYLTPTEGDAAYDGLGAATASTATHAATPHGFANPMTTAGDLIVGGAAGAPARLAKGADGTVLTVDPATHLLVWAASASGFANPMTSKGDLIVGDTGGAAVRLAAGTATYVLTSGGAGAFPSWAAPAAAGRPSSGPCSQRPTSGRERGQWQPTRTRPSSCSARPRRSRSCPPTRPPSRRS